MAVLIRTRKQEKGVSTKHNNVEVLKVVHPRGYVEVFREPITASQIIKRYPRYCIARPDFFEFPWIVVHPESILVPGKVFYLVPHRTIHNLLKAKQQQIQNHPTEVHNNSHQNRNKQISSSPIKSYAGVTPKHHRHQDKDDHEYSCCDNDSHDQYKPSFYKLWNKMKRNLDDEMSCYDEVDDDSPPYGGRPHVTSDEYLEFRRLSSCLRRDDSDRKKLNLRVTFWLESP